MPDITNAEAVYRAALSLSAANAGPFSLEGLVAACCAAYPSTFSPPTARQRVRNTLWGPRGLITKSHLLTPEVNLFELGKPWPEPVVRSPPKPAAEHANGNVTSPLPLVGKRVLALQALLASAVTRKFAEGRKLETTLADALAFWSIGNGADGARIDERLKATEKLLGELCEADWQLADGRVVSAGELRALLHVHRVLLERYARALELLRQRVKKGATA